MHEACDVVRAGRFEQRERAVVSWCATTGSGERMLRSTCDSAAKCTMASGRSSPTRRVDHFRIADIALHEAVALVAIDARQVLQISRVGQLIQVDDAQVCLADRHTDKGGADETRPAGHQNFHGISFPSELR